jgi:hypothetical protein
MHERTIESVFSTTKAIRNTGRSAEGSRFALFFD